MDKIKKIKKRKRNKIGREAAEVIVDKFFDYYELDELVSDENEEEGEGDLSSEKVKEKAKKKAANILEKERPKENDLVIEAVEACYDALISHTRKGRMDIDDSAGFPMVIQKLKTPMEDGTVEIRWMEPTASARVEMSKAKEGDNEGKMLYFMGAIGKDVDAIRLLQLKSLDAALMETLATAFFLVG